MCVGAFVAPGATAESHEDLVEAAYHLNLDRLNEVLNKNVDVNAKYGKYDKVVFSNPWDGGFSHVGSRNWTPLLAVANASELPPPPPEVENSSDHNWTRQQAGQVPRSERKKRRELKLRVAERLIKAGAHVNAHDGNGATALYEAAGFGHLELVLLLIEHKARVNTKTAAYFDGPDDLTPLHQAVRYPDVVAALIAAKAEVSARDSAGNTPLHYACLDARLAAVRLLLDAGADREAANAHGDQPVDCMSALRPSLTERAILALLSSHKPKRHASAHTRRHALTVPESAGTLRSPDEKGTPSP